MKRRICAYRNYFTDFIASIKEVEARKVFYVLDMLKMQERLSEKFVKHIEDGIFELRENMVGIFSGFSSSLTKGI